MGIFDRFLGRKAAAPRQTDRYRSVSKEPLVSDEQLATNRSLMEAQMAASRERRERATTAGDPPPATSKDS